jgi:histidyl-tRNA synthetase
VCGGGRYDDLIETLGGKPAPGIGFGLGMERLMLLLDATGRHPPAGPADLPDAYAIVPDAAALPIALPLLADLRARGLAIVMHAAGREGAGSIKSQFRKADASGARHALVFGADELATGQVTIKPLRDAAMAQTSLPLGDPAALAEWLQRR